LFYRAVEVYTVSARRQACGWRSLVGTFRLNDNGVGAVSGVHSVVFTEGESVRKGRINFRNEDRRIKTRLHLEDALEHAWCEQLRMLNRRDEVNVCHI
jgi:hypothetical protein